MKLTIHIKLIVSLAVVMAVRTPTAKAQKIVQPAPQCPVGAVGGVECTVVNSALTNFWQTCSLSYPLKLIKTSDLQKDASRQSIAEDSGIPVQIVSALNADPLKAPYQIPNTVSLPRLLTQIFTAADVTKIDLNDYIKEMSSASVSTLQQVGINWSIYTSNCQDSLAAALANNSGFTLSPVQLTATLKASGSTSTKSSLLVATGHFDSPFAVQSSDPNRFYLNMLLLRWRLDEATPSRSAFLLAHAHGASFSQLTSSQLDASLAATGGASAGFVVSSTNLSAQLSYDINSSSQGGFFNGVIDTPSSSDFIAVPSIADLQQAIQQQAFAVPSSPQKNVFAFEGDVIHITQTIVGIQGDICQSGGWQIHDASLPSPVPADTQEDWIAKSIRTAPSQSGAVPACTFDFDIAQGSSGKSQFSATPQLRGKIPSKTIGNFALTLNTLSLSDNPYPSFQSGAIASPDFSNAAKIQYQIPLVIVQGPTGSGYNRLDLAGTYAAQCNGNARTLKLQASTPGTPIQVQANNQTQVNLPLFVALVDAPGTPGPRRLPAVHLHIQRR